MEEGYPIIANGFIEASGIGAQLRRREYLTKILFIGKPVDSRKFIAIDTGSRDALPGHAYEIVRHSLKQVDFGQFYYIIKKVDSAMREDISQKIRAMGDAFRPGLMVFTPTLPVLGRTTMGEVQCLNGVEICKIELSKGPKNPVVEDNPVKLLEQVYEESVQLKYLPDIRSQSLLFSGDRTFVCDAESDDDLRQIIAAAGQNKRRALYVGTTGMAGGLMELEKPIPPSSDVVVGISSVVNEQMRYYERVGYAMVRVPVARIMTGTVRPGDYRNTVVEYLGSGRDTILLVDTAYDRELIEPFQEVGEKSGMDLTEVGDCVHSLTGRMTKKVLDSAAVSGVHPTRGNAAPGVLANIGTDGSEIPARILAGAPLVRVKGGTYEGLKLVTRVGAFGTENAATFVVRKIKGREGV